MFPISVAHSRIALHCLTIQVIGVCRTPVWSMPVVLTEWEKENDSMNQWSWTFLVRTTKPVFRLGLFLKYGTISQDDFKALTRPYVRSHNVFQGNHGIRARNVHVQCNVTSFCNFNVLCASRRHFAKWRRRL